MAKGDLDRLRGLIDNPGTGTLKAIYATPKPWDANCAKAVTTIETYIGQADTACYIQNILVGQFGINATDFVGL